MSEDVLLQRVVSSLNGDDEETPSITLHMQGLLISGEMIGASEYLEHLAEEFEGAPGELLKKAAEDTGAADDADVHFIHLADAQFFDIEGRPLPSDEGVLWRGRIDKVDSFFFGRLSGEGDDDDG
ncbi:gas vesicle accessory protein GvpU [Alkalicoccus urumqiensis]|uniref:Gas vesicle protein GvpU n=1 Tax=Alkalicoccus urumqiensis TaxID=1548213 RepID=A0A2P6MIU2_ALKUR|nr:gas vesicle accessory protein GvpU [Alkalicoccus urumqiensis]PRO66188.1 hypothetical protein C6I21_05130 [Alkalicoccus urumqiensis]